MNENSTASGTGTMAELKPGGPVNGGTAFGPQNGRRDDWYRLPIEAVFDALETSAEGLTGEEAGGRLVRFGPNRLPESKKTSLWMQFLLQFHNPLIYVLLGTGVITAILGEWIDSGVIVGSRSPMQSSGSFRRRRRNAPSNRYGKCWHRRHWSFETARNGWFRPSTWCRAT